MHVSIVFDQELLYFQFVIIIMLSFSFDVLAFSFLLYQTMLK